MSSEASIVMMTNDQIEKQAKMYGKRAVVVLIFFANHPRSRLVREAILLALGRGMLLGEVVSSFEGHIRELEELHGAGREPGSLHEATDDFLAALFEQTLRVEIDPPHRSLRLV